eukprot:CAMPEP_0196581284 /NCGR_PEP_ID=MMETSP1081-20130531/33426_1 /TAXON_ID=36882 /ORGANISM="Pyramimonas amylifera, Strain CCMP720" /LENGTH=344 /DNA_ID=CAMNT_0041901461 /DNA_START=65 /DNA_END=1099 /DNA_ORIENTATION=+
MKCVTVFGAFVVDLVLRPLKLPSPGETVLAPGYSLFPGGKGANQALAAALSGARVRMVGALGDDAMADISTKELKRAGVDLTAVKRVEEHPTGVSAVVVHDATGENQICVGVGANASVKEGQFTEDMFKDTVVLVLQMEIPLEQNWAVLYRAKEYGILAVLNCAPVGLVPTEALLTLDYLMLNEVEARGLSEQQAEAIRSWSELVDIPVFDVDDWDGEFHKARSSMAAIASVYDLTVVITLGPNGAEAVTSDNKWVHVNAVKVEVLDTVGAGDAFVGAFAAALAEGAKLEKCMKVASISGSMACTIHGAQEGRPITTIVADIKPEVSIRNFDLPIWDETTQAFL